jgi:hypothetical protein
MLPKNMRIITLLFLLAFTLPCKGIVVDFNNIPNGTLVSVNNPYAGILDIQALAGTWWFNPELEPEEGIISIEAAISNGYLELLPLLRVEDPSGTLQTGILWFSAITATFSQPVTNVSFDAFTYRHAVYQYRVVDANGVTSNVIGGETQDDAAGLYPLLFFDTFNLNIPEGGYLTSFELTNVDGGSSSDAGIWLDNIAFDLAASPVSDAGSTATLLGIALGVLCLLRCKSFLPRTMRIINLLFLLVFTLPCKGVVVDFNNIPSGTAVSVNNPYAGILDIQASAGPAWFIAEHELEPGGMGIAWMKSTVFDGYLPVIPSFNPPPGTELGDNWYARIMATFSQPVTNVSFDAFTQRHASYDYTVVDANGVPSNVAGGETQNDVEGPFEFDTFNLNIPEGSYLTSFQITNQDPGSPNGASIWLDNIRFDLVASSVPDAGSTATLLGIVLGVLCLFKCKSLLSMGKTIY